MKRFFWLFIIVLFPICSFADDNIAVTAWQEKSYLNNQGKDGEILIKAKVKNLPQNYRINSFSFGFGTENSIRIKNVICDNKNAKSTFNNNVLRVEIPQPKANGEEFTLYVSYQEKYQKINKFLRQEAISVPAFAAGAKAKIIIEFPSSMESATLNYNVKQQGNSFIYENLVPQNGIIEIIKLTPAQSSWKAISRVRLKSNGGVNGVKVEVPKYFDSTRQLVKDSSLVISSKEQKNYRKEDKTIVEFTGNENEVTIETIGHILTGKNFRRIPAISAADYISYSTKDRELLDNILQQIKQSRKYQGFPLYAKIGFFVHEFIKYDKSYVDKLPSLQEILLNPVGVCTEYSSLYNALARIAGIPSIILNGVACGEYDKCEGHAWNMIYYNNRWLEVDATWNLMSGIVSSSHIYYGNHGKQNIAINYPSDGRTIQAKIEDEVENLD